VREHPFALVVVVLAAACGSQASRHTSPPAPPLSATAVTDVSVLVTDKEQCRVSCADRTPRRISVELDGHSLGTQSIPCMEGFVSPPPVTTFAASASVGKHVLVVVDAGAARRVQREVELIALERGATVDTGVYVDVQVSDQEIRIGEPIRGIPGAM